MNFWCTDVLLQCITRSHRLHPTGKTFFSSARCEGAGRLDAGFRAGERDGLTPFLSGLRCSLFI